VQGRNEVRCRPGREAVWRPPLGAPMFEPEVYRNQIYCIDENACGIVETFQRLAQWFGAPIIRRPGNCAPHTPSLRLCLRACKRNLGLSRANNCYGCFTHTWKLVVKATDENWRKNERNAVLCLIFSSFFVTRSHRMGEQWKKIEIAS